MFGMAYIENVIIEYRCIWLSGNMFSLNQRLLKSQPGSSQKAPSFLHFLFCWCPKWTNKISPEVILPGCSYFLCKTELVWLPHPWGQRIMKWFCPVAELGGGRGQLFLVFLLACVQGGIRARRGNRKAQGHFSESSHSPRLWLNGSPSEVDSQNGFHVTSWLGSGRGEHKLGASSLLCQALSLQNWLQTIFFHSLLLIS